MDSTTFKTIFSKDIYQLPIRWDDKDFYATLYKHLKKYREDLENCCSDNPDLCAEVKTVCRDICAAVNFSFRGYPGKAYESFKSVMEILGKDPLLIDKEDINKEPLYRVVDVENAAIPSRQRVFHVPFNMRSRMSTQRYSIPGFPCLYLGTSVKLCCLELGKDPQRDYVCVSRYELQTDKRISTYSYVATQNPVFDNDEFMIFDVSIKPDEAIETLRHDDEIIKYIKWYPLISVCSYIRAMRDDPYSAEYIIPQLFIQWVRSEYEEAVIGIKYFSCASVCASTLGYNYAFPTMGTPYHARKPLTDYCPRLSHRFKLTAPRLIMEYSSLNNRKEVIEKCEEVIEEDNNLDYIEDCNAGEDKVVKGKYKIPEGVSAIGAFAFSLCSSLKSIDIPDSVITIGDFAFFLCSSLTRINIPDSVIAIGDNAFDGCSKLKRINIPDSVKSIGCNVFYGCNKLKRINIPNRVTTIGNYAFESCINLQKICIPGSVTSIGDHAFYSCSSLTSINIPDSVKSIGYYAFCNCNSLKSINVNRSNLYYSSARGVLYNKKKDKLICYPAGKNQTSFKIPSGVTSIRDDAFQYCNSLKSVDIPDGVTSIGDSTFSECHSLTCIKIPNSIKSIGDHAFSECGLLESINIPDGVTSIGESAFYSCSSLTDINVDEANIYYLSIDGALYNKKKDKLICYPAGKNQTSFKIPSGVTSIDDDAFSSCRSLTSITIPDSVTSIGNYAFFDCSSLKTVYYSGAPEQAEKINIGARNEHLMKAKWGYGSSSD